MVTVYPKGTTIYKPEKCYGGYTLFPSDVQGDLGAKLINMNGEAVHEWKFNPSKIKGSCPRVRLLKNGHIIVLRGDMETIGGVQEYDWNNRLVWEYIPPLPSHHDIFKKGNGNVLIICREKVPEEYRRKAKDPRRRDELYSDVIFEVTPDKKIEWEWHEYEHINIDRCNWITASRDWWGGPNNNTITDWTHTNTVQALPKNKWYDKGNDRFKPENVLLSLRQLDTILIVDRESKKIVWEYTGDYKGSLSGQHEPHMIEKELPGKGNILIFDNGTSPHKDLAHAGCSFVLEINPVTKKVIWVYSNKERFHSNFTSSAQRLTNGNTFINETTGHRIFEVSGEKEIVWEYVYPTNPSTRSYRYSYDYCSQMRNLGKQKEIPVTPPTDMRIPPGKLALE